MTHCHAPSHLFSALNLNCNIPLCLLAAILLLGCQPASEALPPASSQSYFPISIGERELQLQLALTPEEQQKGLMFRDHLAEGHGMLFLFEKPAQRSFWMRQTRIPLDIGYFDSEGILIERYKLFPFDETPVRSKSSAILIAVETNQGWYERHDIKAGARIDLVALQTALERRGFRHLVINP